MRKQVVYISIFFLFLFHGFSVFAADEINFNRGLVYYLIGDFPEAQQYFNRYFANSRDLRVKNGFDLLMQKKLWDATKQFMYHLDVDQRSIIALVGLSLSMVEMKNTNPIANLNRALRLNPQYSPAHVCIGMEYFKNKDYPSAEKHLNRALKISGVSEYKILLSYLYLEMNEAAIVLDLLKQEADANPHNFYYGFLTAKAYLNLNQLPEAEKYIHNASLARPDDKSIKLLMAELMYEKKEYKKAESILNNLDFDTYNIDYVKTKAQVLFELNDKRAKDALFEVFSQKKWDKDINRLLGLFYMKESKEENIQNWIYRSIMSGNDINVLKSLFKGNYIFPEYVSLPFFSLKKVHWVDINTLTVFGQLNSGESEKVFIIDVPKVKIVKSIPYSGGIQDFFSSKDHKNIVFSASDIENETVFVYCLKQDKAGFVLTPIFPRPVEMPRIIAGFSPDNETIYFTNGIISSLAFEAPFSKLGLYGKKEKLYPNFPYKVFAFNCRTNNVSTLGNNKISKAVPISDLQKFMLVAEAYSLNDKIKAMIQRGEALDLTSFEIIKIHFPADLSSFVIYSSDIDNPFQGLIYSSVDNKVLTIDSAMLLGKVKYSEVSMVHFAPQLKTFVVIMKDKQRNLISYNYDSKLSRKLASDFFDYCLNATQDVIYLLSERTDKIYYKESNFEVISLNPYSRKKLSNRKDIIVVHGLEREYGPVLCSTYKGEWLHMDEEYRFYYVGPALDNAVYDVVPEKKNAVFINHKLYIFNPFI